MSNQLNTILVILAVVSSIAYLIWRKVRSARKTSRDWTSGHAEACDSCPIIEVRKAQERIQLSSK